MSLNRKLKRRGNRWLAGAAAGLATIGHDCPPLQAAMAPPPSGVLERPQTLNGFIFRHEQILGTSMELIVRASGIDVAQACERAVIAEIERLRSLLSTYDPASGINRFQAGAIPEPPELSRLLAAYAWWSEHTGGVVHPNLAAVIRLWRQAEREQALPDTAALRAAVSAPFSLNVDALGKGFIIDRAVEAARRIAPAGLLDIGGDLRAWGDIPFPVAVADPSEPAENSPPLATFTLRDAAVSTSGGYERFYSIAGRRYSHVIDPRTLQPVDHRVGATFVAPDCVTANALSTAACVLGMPAAAELARIFDAAGFLVTDAARGAARGGLLAAGPDVPAETKPAAPPTDARAWPKDYRVTINLELKSPDGFQSKRPYVAVWIEDSREKIVRTVTVWGAQPKYIPELSNWWQAAGGDRTYGRVVTRATRPAGKYTLVWDGLDDAGKPLPKGEYTVAVEINREHGRHALEYAMLVCADKKDTADIRATAESEASTVQYGPKPE